LPIQRTLRRAARKRYSPAFLQQSISNRTPDLARASENERMLHG